MVSTLCLVTLMVGFVAVCITVIVSAGVMGSNDKLDVHHAYVSETKLISLHDGGLNDEDASDCEICLGVVAAS